MKIIGLFVLLFLASCSLNEDTARMEATLIYLKAGNGDITDAEGRAYFQRMSADSASTLYNILSDHLRQLELDESNPQKHYDAECTHSLGMCEIKSNIGITTQTIIYMTEARSESN